MGNKLLECFDRFDAQLLAIYARIPGLASVLKRLSGKLDRQMEVAEQALASPAAVSRDLTRLEGKR